MNASSLTKDSRLHALVFGHVQGVGYRYFVVDQARQTGLTGWVRNLPTGAVEVLAEGTKKDLEALLTRLRRGPTGARVSDVSFDWSAFRGEFDRFSVKSY